MSLIHTCYRILDIDRSVEFYEALGFNEIGRLPIRDEAINVFMGLPEDGPEPRLELTCNIGRDEPYDVGTGYGHIAITTTDLDGTLQRLSTHVNGVLSRTPHLVDLHPQSQGFVPQIQETVDAPRAARYGLTPGNVRREAAEMLGTVELGEIWNGAGRLRP